MAGTPVKTEQWPVQVRAVCVELSELCNQLHTYNESIMSVLAYFHLWLAIGVKKLLWCARALSSFCHGVRCGQCHLASQLSQPTPRTVKPLPEVTGTCWRTFWLQQSTVCACCIPHGCAAEHPSSTTHFSIRPVRSPDLLVFPRGNESLPQRVSSCRRQWLFFPADHIYCFRWRSLSDTVWQVQDVVCRLCVGRAWSFWLVVAVAWGYVWLEYKLCELFLPHPIRSRTNLDVSK